MNCWFCSLRESEAKHALAEDLYGEVGVQSTPSQSDVVYRVRHVEVPRCNDCHKRHRQAHFSMILAAVFAVLLLFGILSALMGWIIPLLSGLWMGFAAGLILAALLASALLQKGIHTVAASRTQYPEIQELLQQNYRFGTQPKSALPKTEPPESKADSDDNKAE